MPASTFLKPNCSHDIPHYFEVPVVINGFELLEKAGVLATSKVNIDKLETKVKALVTSGAL